MSRSGNENLRSFEGFRLFAGLCSHEDGKFCKFDITRQSEQLARLLKIYCEMQKIELRPVSLRMNGWRDKLITDRWTNKWMRRWMRGWMIMLKKGRMIDG